MVVRRRAVPRTEGPCEGAHRSPVPQVCPHLVNVAAALWKQPAETFTRDRQMPNHRRSEGCWRPTGGGAGGTAGKGRGERGETRRGPNITPCGGPRQGAIHRFWKPGTRARTAGGRRADFHIRPARTGSGPRADAGDLTSPFAPAYRFSVTRCRRVPHVHVLSAVVLAHAWWEYVGGRCRPKPQKSCAEVPGSCGFRSAPSDANRAIWPKHRRDPSLTIGDKS
jgi:hypothetical protein